MTFGEKLQKLRQRASMSQDVLAEKLGCSNGLAWTADGKTLYHIDTLVDVQGTKANPHEVMTLTAGHKDIVCADCHSEHGPELDEAMVCVSCHHMGTYECNTCHEAA